MKMKIAYFDPDKNLHIYNEFWDKHSANLGKMMMYYLILKAKNSPYKTRTSIRNLLGISTATEWRYREKLKELKYI